MDNQNNNQYNKASGGFNPYGFQGAPPQYPNPGYMNYSGGYPPPQYYPAPPVKPVIFQPNGIPVEPLPEEKKYIKNKYNWVGGVLLIHVVIMIVLMIVTMLFQDKMEYSLMLMSVNAVCVTIANILAVIIGCKATKIKLKPMFNVQKVSGRFLTFAVFIGLGIQGACFFSVSIMSSILYSAGIDITSSFPDIEMTTSATIVSLVYTCILAPIFEELLFRGFVLKNLSRFNTTFGIIASGLLFGLFHGNLMQFVTASILGMFLAYISVKSNSLIPSIAVHIAVNTTLALLELIVDAINADLTNVVIIIWFLAMVILGSVLLIIAVVKYKHKIPKQNIPQKKRGFILFFSSCNIIIFIIFYFLQIVSTISLV